MRRSPLSTSRALALGLLLAVGIASPAAATPRGGDHAVTEDTDHNDGGTPDNVADSGDNRHPSGRDRSVEHGGSGNQGRSASDPDDDGRGPDRSNGGPDKPGGSGGRDLADQDGNNGCGNDDDFEDDNEGWCGRQRAARPAPTPPAHADGSCGVQQGTHGCGRSGAGATDSNGNHTGGTAAGSGCGDRHVTGSGCSGSGSGTGTGASGTGTSTGTAGTGTAGTGTATPPEATPAVAPATEVREGGEAPASEVLGEVLVRDVASPAVASRTDSGGVLATVGALARTGLELAPLAAAGGTLAAAGALVTAWARRRRST